LQPATISVRFQLPEIISDVKAPVLTRFQFVNIVYVFSPNTHVFIVVITLVIILDTFSWISFAMNGVITIPTPTFTVKLKAKIFKAFFPCLGSTTAC